MYTKRILLTLIVGVVATVILSAYSAADAAQPNLVGTWKVTISTSTGGLPPFEALQTFNADGTMIETSSLLGQGEEGPAHGVWSGQGDDFNSTFYLFIFDKESGEHTGMVRVRTQMHLDTLDHLTAQTAVDLIAPDGSVTPNVDSGPFEATRLKVEPLLDPITVVKSYYDALNAKDIDQAMSFVANDAVFINPTGTYEDPDAIRDSLQGLATENITFELSNFRDTDGRVVYDYQVLQGKTVLETGTDGLTIVKNGKIVFDGTERTKPE